MVIRLISYVFILALPRIKPLSKSEKLCYVFQINASGIFSNQTLPSLSFASWSKFLFALTVKTIDVWRR